MNALEFELRGVGSHPYEVWTSFAKRLAGRWDRGDLVRIKGKTGLFFVEGCFAPQGRPDPIIGGVCLRRLEGDAVPAEGDVCVRATERHGWTGEELRTLGDVRTAWREHRRA